MFTQQIELDNTISVFEIIGKCSAHDAVQTPKPVLMF